MNKSSIAATLRKTRKLRYGLLLFAASICATAVPLAAQSAPPKQITGLKLGPETEGSRVTIVSDSALSDYEAFRRNDRFYVKIPLAAFPSKVPQFRAEGFENVQVRKSPDGVVVSFKLQPGATARVDQSSNQLDVIFSSPKRVLRDSLASNAVPAESLPTFEGNLGGAHSGLRGRNAGRLGPHLAGEQSGDGGKSAASSTTALDPLRALPATNSTTSPAATTQPATPPQVSKSDGDSGGVPAELRQGNISNGSAVANRLLLLLAGLTVLSLVCCLLIRARRRKLKVRSNRIGLPAAPATFQATLTPLASLDEPSPGIK